MFFQVKYKEVWCDCEFEIETEEQADYNSEEDHFLGYTEYLKEIKRETFTAEIEEVKITDSKLINEIIDYIENNKYNDIQELLWKN